MCKMTRSGESMNEHRISSARNSFVQRSQEKIKKKNMARPVQIVSISDNGTFQLHEEPLKEILLADNVKDKPVVVVSVFGTFREGKSFLLNYLLRYLSSNGKTGWMGKATTPLTGFQWSKGTAPCTKGILVWSEVFPVRTADGEEAVVLLMDTQGSFDKESTGTDSIKLYVLSLLTSSLQIYNILRNIHESHLDYLRLIAEYGMAFQKLQPRYLKPFQKLVFLVRDWFCPTEYAYGREGGHAYLRDFMKTTQDARQQNTIRQILRSCFSDIECFLMPEPGKAAKSERFDGSLQHLDNDFNAILEELGVWLLAPKTLEAKKFCQKKVSCKELINYFKMHALAIMEGTGLTVTSLVEATMAAGCKSAVEDAKRYYILEMNKAKYATFDDVKNNHERLYKEAEEIFRAVPKLCDHEHSEMYMGILKKEIEDFYEPFLQEKHTLFDTTSRAKIIGLSVGTALTASAAAAAAPFFLPVAGALALGTVTTAGFLAKEVVERPPPLESSKTKNE